MDNFSFRMVGDRADALGSALALVWLARGMSDPTPHARPDYKRAGATHYAIRSPFEGEREDVPEGTPKHFVPGWRYGREPKPLRLVFFDNRYRSDTLASDQMALPFTLDAIGCADFARRWLAEAEYGGEPDHDGDNKKGWLIYNERYGQVDGDYGAIIAIAPVWTEYGK